MENMASLNNIFAVLLFLMGVKCFASGESCDKYGVLLYEDIACQPVKAEGENCPSKYECNFNRPKSGCTFKGRNYGPREEITSDLTYSGCSIGCFCEDFDYIECAVLDCPEDVGELNDPGCYNEYELGKCCSIGQTCNVTADAKKCQIDGKSYEIGQIFYPKNTCYTCVCHENFTGEYDAATCMRLNCLSQIHYTQDLIKKCAPAYFNYRSEAALCCPDEFICPEDSDTIKVINREADQDSDLKCDYGDQKLTLGEGFNRRINKYGKDRNLRCECILPPLVTCREV